MAPGAAGPIIWKEGHGVDGDSDVEMPAMCPTCVGAGELITLDGPPRLGTCPRCEGSGRLTLVCPAEQATDIAEAAAGAMMRARVTAHAVAMLDGAGICLWCLGSKRSCWIERDANNRPIRYAEADCPACSGAVEMP